MLNLLAVKTLLVLRLRAIWNKDLIGKRAKNMDRCTRYMNFLDSSHINSIYHDGGYVLYNLISDR